MIAEQRSRFQQQIYNPCWYVNKGYAPDVTNRKSFSYLRISLFSMFADSRLHRYLRRPNGVVLPESLLNSGKALLPWITNILPFCVQLVNSLEKNEQTCHSTLAKTVCALTFLINSLKKTTCLNTCFFFLKFFCFCKLKSKQFFQVSVKTHAEINSFLVIK